MIRLVAVSIVAAAVAAPGAAARKPIALALDAAAAVPGDEVTVRGAVPARLGPLRLYLVRESHAREIRARSDPRAVFVGVLARGTLVFTLPPLDAGTYVLAYWCRRCVQGGRTLVVARASPLHVQVPNTAGACARSRPNGKRVPGLRPSAHLHGNGVLAAFVGDGRYVAPEPDGTVFTKMIWVAASAERPLEVSYRRIAGSGEETRAESIRGTLSGFAGPSWASRMYFSEGCWRVTGRIGDISLSFVVEVVRP